MSKHKMHGGETAAHTQTYRLYDLCRWHDGDLEHMRRQVRTPDGSVHSFHARRLDAHRREVKSLIRRLCCMNSLYRPEGGGCPWFCLMQGDDSFPLQAYSPTVCLLAIGLAASLIRLKEVDVPQLIERVTYAVVLENRIKTLKT